MFLEDIMIQKKNGTLEDFDITKICEAVNQSAARARGNKTETLTDEEMNKFVSLVETDLMQLSDNVVKTEYLHMLCEKYLSEVAPDVGTAYSNYHSFRMGQAKLWDKVMGRCSTLVSDASDDEAMTEKRQNANADATLASTMKCFFADYTSEAYYEEFFLTAVEKQILKDGYIYAHDKNGRSIYPLNCCLFRADYVLENGFEMNGIHYNKPKTLDKAFDVLGDVILMCASQQYGGFTVPRIDTLLAQYAEASYQIYLQKYTLMGVTQEGAAKQAYEDVKEDMYNGFQGLELKLNTVASSRGDYPFTTISFGLDNTKWGKLASIAALDTRRKGQGEKGKKKPVLFPKLVFLYDENLHGPGMPMEDVFEAGILCSSKTMYPDWLSLTGDGYVPSMYKQYGEVISPMGCVDGDEIITYKINGKIHTGAIATVWSEMDKAYGNVGQRNAIDENRLIDLRNKGIQIYDTIEGFVDLHFMNRNISTQWCTVTLKHTNPNIIRTVRVTDNHLFETENRGVVYAKDLIQDDLILVKKDIDSMKPYNYVMARVDNVVSETTGATYSYDVTTTSEHFEFSGVYSHNCRAFLSPWYERGGINPADADDKPVFEGRFNIGVFSLHLPMILAKAQKENKDFFELLDYYLEVIRKLHKRTYEALSHKKASINPVGFCYGGFYGGNLKPTDSIKPVLKYSTASFGVTALNELQQLYNQKSIYEDGQFAFEVMEYINEKLAEFKKEDNILYAVYGTPAEKLCNTQVRQFRALYGVVENVSNRDYVSNSFHCHVTENITPIQKQNAELRFWNHFNGGKIQYCRYPLGYNIESMRILIRRAMKLGFYEGVNMSLCFCDDCGHAELEIGMRCPKCNSVHITQIDRMNGYLSFTRIGKDAEIKTDKDGNEIIMVQSRFAPHKIHEIQDRVSM